MAVKLACRNYAPGVTPSLATAIRNRILPLTFNYGRIQPAEQRYATSHVPELDDDDIQLRPITNQELFKEVLIPKTNKLKWHLAISTVSLVGSKYMGLQTAKHMNTLTRELQKASRESDWSRQKITRAVLLYGGTKVLASGLNELRNAAFSAVASASISSTAAMMFDRIHSTDLEHLASLKAGELTTTVNMGTKAMGTLMTNMAFRVLPLAVETTLVVRRLSRTKSTRHLGWMTAGTMATYFAFTYYISNIRVSQRQRLATAEKRSNGVIHESLTNSETIRIFGTAQQELERYHNAQKMVDKHTEIVAASLGGLNFGQNFILSSGLVATVYSTAKAILANQADLGELVGSVTALTQLSHPLHYVGTMMREIKTSLDFVEKMKRIMTLPAACVEKPNAVPIIVRNGDVEIRNVQFAYRNTKKGVKNDKGDKPAKRLAVNLSAKIKGGSTMAIVGPSGAGKSTLIKLIARLRDPASGSVLIDGQDLRDVSLKSLRRVMSVVPQEVILFNESLRMNLTYGCPKVSDADISEVLKLVQLEDLVKRLPKGLDSPVGERGQSLSGGERQRVGIARAILRKPKLLILDEATSNLDLKTEKLIIDNIHEVLPDTTVVLVAHRLGAVANADSIILIQDGEVKEQGSHVELLQNPNGLYKQLWVLQSRERNVLG